MIKKIIYILLLIIIFSANSVLAQMQEAYIQYNGYQYKFNPGDDAKFIKNANINLENALKTKNINDRVFYLQESMRYYFLLSLVKPDSIDAQIGLGRIYDEMLLDRYAKKHFFNAINFNSKNPKANMYFADFYYKRNELIPAVYYYKKSYESGYSSNYYVNYMLGTVYEKLADLETAKRYYARAMVLNTSKEQLPDKLRLLDDLNYSQSQYYLFKK